METLDPRPVLTIPIDMITVPTAIYGRAGNCLESNIAFRSIFSSSQDEHEELDLERVFGPDNMDLLDEMFHRVEMDHGPAKELLFIQTEHRYTFYSILLNAISDDHWMLTLSEVLPNRLLDGWMNKSSKLIWLLSRNGTVLEASKKAIRLTGMKKNDLKGSNFIELNSWFPYHEVRSALKLNLDLALAGEYSYHEVEMEKSGINFPISLSMTPVLDDNGQTKFIIVEGMVFTQISQLQNELTQNAKLFDGVRSMVRMGYWKLDLKNSEVHWDDTVYSLHEVEAGKVIDLDTAVSFYREPFREGIQEKVEMAMKERSSYDYEAEIVTAKGRPKWVRTIGYPVYKNGEVKELRGLILDMSDWHKLNVQREQAMDQFKILFEEMDALVCLMDTEGNFVDVSPSAIHMLGVPNSQVTGKRWTDVLHRNDRNAALSALKDLQQKGKGYLKRFEARFKHADGSLRWILCSIALVSGDDSHQPLIVFSGKDITEKIALEQEMIQDRKKLESQVKEQNKRFKQLSNRYTQQFTALDSSTLISITDLEGNITYANDAFVERSGYSLEELHGQNHRIMKSGKNPDSLYEDMWSTITKGQVWSGEVCNRTKSGELYWNKTKIYPFRDIYGEIESYMSVRFDITTLKEKEAEIRRKNEAMQSAYKDLEVFSYSVSHDLKAPLRALRGFSSILAEEFRDKPIDERGSIWLQHIQDNAEKMDQLVNDVLKYSRLGKVEMTTELVDVDALVNDLFEHMRWDQANTTRLFKDKLPSISTDRTMVQVIFQNLINNGLKYSSTKEYSEVTIRYATEPGFHCFTISDNGIGFRNEEADYMFTIFKRLAGSEKYEGTGVGLAVVKRLTQRLGGTIDAEGSPGKGAKFTLRLPQYSR